MRLPDDLSYPPPLSPSVRGIFFFYSPSVRGQGGGYDKKQNKKTFRRFQIFGR